MTRLAYCYACECMAKLSDYQGTNPDHDVVLQDWIDRHMHGLSIEEHPGGQLFPVDEAQSDIDRTVVGDDGNVLGELSNNEMEAVQAARAELRKIGKEVNDMRDELRIDATSCHRKHGQPSLPGKPCIDYHADAKRLGRKDTPPEFRQYLCTYCPYESSVVVVKRGLRGDYREGAGQRLILPRRRR